jgi:2-oxoglutarate dehydrogenase dihydrolipoamide succinyltransferase (E2 component)
MPTQVLMPQLGESVDEGTITRWLKSAGDPIEEYEPLLEINTDKVDSEIPSPVAGIVLEILAPEGTTVQAGTLLAWIGEPEEKAPGLDEPEGRIEDTLPVSSPAASSTESPTRVLPTGPVAASAEAPPTPGRNRDLGFISPVVAKMAQEERVDLYQVEGTGQGGRITKKDMLKYLENRQIEPATPIPQTAPPPARLAPTAAAAPPISTELIAGELLPLNLVRRSIAEHMVMSKHTSPHVTTVMEVDLSRVVAHRQAHKDRYARDGANLTFTAYFIAACVTALKAHPIVNSSWSEAGIQLHKNINIGMATSLGEEGLIVPVVKNADGLSLLGLARNINDLAARARARQLKPDEVRGGTFTITNHGVSGSLFATPIINQPQCAILGVGAVQKRAVVISDPNQGDSIAIRPMAYLTLTFDHRILDGAIADYFLAKVVEYLQNWS